MNRGHTREHYLRLVERIRAARPDIAMSGDFIVGFRASATPTSRRRCSWCAEVGYASAFSFKYSRRPGTPASAMPGQVADEVKVERLARLQALLDDQQRAFNAAQVGKILPVLFEKPGRNGGQIAGRSPYLQAVHCDAAREPDRPDRPRADRRGDARQPDRRAAIGERLSRGPSEFLPLSEAARARGLGAERAPRSAARGSL